MLSSTLLCFDKTIPTWPTGIYRPLHTCGHFSHSWIRPPFDTDHMFRRKWNRATHEIHRHDICKCNSSRPRFHHYYISKYTCKPSPLSQVEPMQSLEACS